MEKMSMKKQKIMMPKEHEMMMGGKEMKQKASKTSKKGRY